MTSIVLVTKNRHRLLEQALDSLYAGTPQDQFSLTLVDYDSDDFRVHTILSRYAQKANCALIHLDRFVTSWAHTRNIGVDASSELFGESNYLYLSDNDVYFTPGWLEKLTCLSSKTTLYGFSLWGGQVHPFHHPTTKFEGYNEYASLDGPSWLLEWPIWETYGPLTGDKLGACKGADVDFCARLTNHGHRIAVIDPQVVIHTGLTNTDGENSPGYDIRVKAKVPGVIYE